MYIYDFRLSKHTLFAGPRHGAQGFKEFQVLTRRHSNFLKIMCRDDQLITSSYFYGMLFNIIPLLGKTVQEVTANCNIEDLNQRSKEEFFRAVRRILM